MARHNVYFSLPTRELGKSDIIIEVFSNEEKHGTLTISKGALEWYPSNAKKPYKLEWAYFDKAIKNYFGDK
ncbi:MAG: hypothetical protein M3O67_06210 [Bacteroidota bacterium]|nr:hypothetical protein [Bacteroidota bacterium]